MKGGPSLTDSIPSSPILCLSALACLSLHCMQALSTPLTALLASSSQASLLVWATTAPTSSR